MGVKQYYALIPVSIFHDIFLDNAIKVNHFIFSINLA